MTARDSRSTNEHEQPSMDEDDMLDPDEEARREQAMAQAYRDSAEDDLGTAKDWEPVLGDGLEDE